MSSDLDLMEHVDGETADPAMEARLATDPAAKAKVESLGQMSELLRGHYELAADDVLDARFARMWRDVDEGITKAQPKSIWGRIRGWFERHRGHVVTGMVSAGVVAAIAIALRPGQNSNPDTRVEYQPITVQPAALRTPPAIESLDTPGGTGTVLTLEDEDGNTAVIWVTADDTVENL